MSNSATNSSGQSNNRIPLRDCLLKYFSDTARSLINDPENIDAETLKASIEFEKPKQRHPSQATGRVSRSTGRRCSGSTSCGGDDDTDRRCPVQYFQYVIEVISNESQLIHQYLKFKDCLLKDEEHGANISASDVVSYFNEEGEIDDIDDDLTEPHYEIENPQNQQPERDSDNDDRDYDQGNDNYLYHEEDMRHLHCYVKTEQDSVYESTYTYDIKIKEEHVHEDNGCSDEESHSEESLNEFLSPRKRKKIDIHENGTKGESIQNQTTHTFSSEDCGIVVKGKYYSLTELTKALPPIDSKEAMMKCVEMLVKHLIPDSGRPNADSSTNATSLHHAERSLPMRPPVMPRGTVKRNSEQELTRSASLHSYDTLNVTQEVTIHTELHLTRCYSKNTHCSLPCGPNSIASTPRDCRSLCDSSNDYQMDNGDYDDRSYSHHDSQQREEVDDGASVIPDNVSLLSVPSMTSSNFAYAIESSQSQNSQEHPQSSSNLPNAVLPRQRKTHLYTYRSQVRDGLKDILEENHKTLQQNKEARQQQLLEETRQDGRLTRDSTKKFDDMLYYFESEDGLIHFEMICFILYVLCNIEIPNDLLTYGQEEEEEDDEREERCGEGILRSCSMSSSRVFSRSTISSSTKSRRQSCGSSKQCGGQNSRRSSRNHRGDQEEFEQETLSTPSGKIKKLGKEEISTIISWIFSKKVKVIVEQQSNGSQRRRSHPVKVKELSLFMKFHGPKKSLKEYSLQWYLFAFFQGFHRHGRQRSCRRKSDLIPDATSSSSQETTRMEDQEAEDENGIQRLVSTDSSQRAAMILSNTANSNEIIAPIASVSASFPVVSAVEYN